MYIYIYIYIYRRGPVSGRAAWAAAKDARSNATGVCEQNYPPEIIHIGMLFFRASNQGLESSFCWWTAGQVLAQKDCFVHRTSSAQWDERVTQADACLHAFLPRAPGRLEGYMYRMRVILSFQQPRFRKFTKPQWFPPSQFKRCSLFQLLFDIKVVEMIFSPPYECMYVLCLLPMHRSEHDQRDIIIPSRLYASSITFSAAQLCARQKHPSQSFQGLRDAR